MRAISAWSLESGMQRSDGLDITYKKLQLKAGQLHRETGQAPRGKGNESRNEILENQILVSFGREVRCKEIKGGIEIIKRK